jgi:hypothetical protein
MPYGKGTYGSKVGRPPKKKKKKGRKKKKWEEGFLVMFLQGRKP